MSHPFRHAMHSFDVSVTVDEKRLHVRHSNTLDDAFMTHGQINRFRFCGTPFVMPFTVLSHFMFSVLMHSMFVALPSSSSSFVSLSLSLKLGADTVMSVPVRVDK